MTDHYDGQKDNLMCNSNSNYLHWETKVFLQS